MRSFENHVLKLKSFLVRYNHNINNVAKRIELYSLCLPHLSTLQKLMACYKLSHRTLPSPTLFCFGLSADWSPSCCSRSRSLLWVSLCWKELISGKHLYQILSLFRVPYFSTVSSPFCLRHSSGQPPIALLLAPHAG